MTGYFCVFMFLFCACFLRLLLLLRPRHVVRWQRNTIHTLASHMQTPKSRINKFQAHTQAAVVVVSAVTVVVSIAAAAALLYRRTAIEKQRKIYIGVPAPYWLQSDLKRSSVSIYTVDDHIDARSIRIPFQIVFCFLFLFSLRCVVKIYTE